MLYEEAIAWLSLFVILFLVVSTVFAQEWLESRRQLVSERENAELMRLKLVADIKRLRRIANDGGFSC
jgi:cell division protein FtsL